ncbi:MAG: Gfo/Idh/MocA family oxidoreductase [Ginsengibacter sp.]
MRMNFAIVGCGRIAGRHAENIMRFGTLIAVCDNDRVKADEFAVQHHATSYYGIEDLLQHEKDIQVAIICTPNGLHAVHSIQCLEAGMHVLCEKPLAISVNDAKNMIDVAKKQKKRLFIVKQNRYNPPVVEVKKLLDADKLGKIYSFQINCFWNRPPDYYKDSWRGTKEFDGGTLFTQFSHFIDLLYWMLGDVSRVKSIVKNLGHPEIEIEDTGMVIFEMKSGATGTLNYTVNSYQKNMEGSFVIFAEHGTVKIGGEYLNELEYQMIGNHLPLQIPVSAKPNLYGYYQGSMSNHDKVYEDLVKALNHNEHTMPGAEDGLKTVEIIQMIYQAAALKPL